MVLPLVSCIMPTRNRREYIERAVACYLAQSYPHTELIVVDNGDPVEDLIPRGATYVHVGEERRTTGWMRNKACSLARGQYIAHFDDDDWSHPQRLREQMKAIYASEKSVTGYRSLYFIDEQNACAWRFECGEPYDYALGTSLFYDIRYWRTHPFADIFVGEDDRFVRQAIEESKIHSVAGTHRMIARVHPGNTSAKHPDTEQWFEVPFAPVAAMIGMEHSIALRP